MDEPYQDPIVKLTPTLAQELRARDEASLAGIIGANLVTTFYKTSPTLDAFRRARSTLPPDAALVAFRASVPLSTYTDYSPYIDRFFASAPVPAADITDLLAPGLPAFIAMSSATSGGAPKYFPKSAHRGMGVSNRANRAPGPGGTRCVMITALYRELVHVANAAGAAVASLPVCLLTAGTVRLMMNSPPEKDALMKTLKVPSYSSPLAIGYISNYNAALLMHALFSLADDHLEIINSVFSTQFYDFARVMQDQWGLLLKAIETGCIPDHDGLEPDVKAALQSHLKPNPSRANELHRISHTEEGWMKTAWPNLQFVICVGSGVFAPVIPRIRFYLGPHVTLRGMGFAAGEANIGAVYSERDLNLFKVAGGEYFEYLDVTLPEAEALRASWELVAGRQYEVVLTTWEGLWRYRLGDIVEAAGFDPEDGQPLLRYIQRRTGVLRLAAEFVSELELQDAVRAAEAALGPVAEFTVVVDNRSVPSAYGFLVELLHGAAPGFDEHRAPQIVLERLSENAGFRGVVGNRVSPPTVRALQPGTFREYRMKKVALNKVGGGQVKVPVVTWDEASVKWLLERVEREV